jgi:hypothetical protein
MTAPLLTVLAVFIACTGYAAGRLHQWYRTDLDRDEAYREGYDTATRSTFSLAARLIGPRRDKTAVRASATVHAGRPVAPAPAGSLPQPLGLLAQPGAPVVQPSASPAPPSAPHAATVLSPRSAPASAAAGVDPSSPASPVPTPAPSSPPAFFAPSTCATTPAGGGMPAPGAMPTPVTTPVSGATPPGSAAEAGSPETEPESARSGRHFVPDELVHAATYRLAPDRVARAKVHGAGPDGAPLRPTVPKPRSS